MSHRWVVIAILVAVCACKGKGGAYEIKRDVKRDTKTQTGLPSEMMGSIGDAKPALSITGVTGAIADGMKRAIEKSAVATKGAVHIVAALTPASPSDSGSLDATLEVHALFAHPPQLSRLEGTLRVHLTYSNADGGLLGESLGESITSWFESEKLPTNLGVPTGAAPKVTRIAAGPPNCTLHEDGSVRCWDLGAADALLVTKAGGSIAISAANNFGACGIRKDGTAWCLDAWDNTVALEVRAVCGVSGATDVSVGQATACALLGDGHVRCWPRDAASYAPCADNAAAAEIVGLADAISLETGPFDSCAIRKDGSVACWEHCGKGCSSRYMGRIDRAAPPKAVAVKGIANAKQLVYSFQPCAWVGDDHVVCAANKDLKGSDTVVPEPIKKLVRERTNACALSTKGNLFCARGGGEYEKFDGASDLVDVGSGIGGSCGVNSKNEVVCWGGMSGDDPVRPVALTY